MEPCVHHGHAFLQILVMSFPDKYHVHTLRELLDTCLLLQPGVELDKILSALIGRMTDHAARCPAAGPIADQSAFHMFLSAARESGIRSAPPPHLTTSLCNKALRSTSSWKLMDSRQSCDLT